MLFRWILFGFLVSAATGAEPLRVIVVEGEGAINNVRLQRAKEPVVRVETLSGSPVPGAAVTFLAPTQGPGAVFLNDSPTTTVITDSEGRATGRGLRPNKTAGQFEIRVNASFEGSTATARVIQTNVEPIEIRRGSSKTIAILAIVGGAVAGGAAFAARGGGSRSPGAAAPAPSAPGPATPTPTGTVIRPGSPTIGAP